MTYIGCPKRVLLPCTFGGEDISANLRDILGHSTKCGGQDIPDPRLSVKCAYNTTKSASDVLVGSLLGGTNLNYIAHKGCAHRASANVHKQQDASEKATLARRKKLADGVGLNRLLWAIDRGV